MDSAGYFFIADNNLGYLLIGVTNEKNCPFFFNDFKIIYHKFYSENLMLIFNKKKKLLKNHNCVFVSNGFFPNFYYMIYEKKINNILIITELFDKFKL